MSEPRTLLVSFAALECRTCKCGTVEAYWYEWRHSSAVSGRVDQIQSINRLVLDELDRAEARLLDREAVARVELDTCASEREILHRKRQTLIEAERIQIEAIEALERGATPSSVLPRPAYEHTQASSRERAEPVQVGEKKVKARLGTQRYLIFDALRIYDDLNLSDIAEVTGLVPRRVKEQVKSDVDIGMIAGFFPDGASDNSSDVRFSLTADGFDLLNRFEAYRKAIGKPLPTISDIRDEDANDASAEVSRTPSSSDEEFDDDILGDSPVGADNAWSGH